MTRNTRSPGRRRGAILLVVITLIALFSVVALSFVLYAESEATAARIHREATDDPSGDTELPYMPDAGLFATQLLYGGTGANEDFLSGVYGNDLGRLRFVSNTGTPIAVAATGRGVPQMPSNAGSANPIPQAVGPQMGVFSGVGGLSATDDGAALGLAPTPLLVNGVGVPRHDVANYGPVVDINGLLSVLPEYTGFQRFAGAWTPVTATGGAYTGTQAPQFISRAAAYTYPDVNNLFLAQVRPDTGEVVTPSFHRSYVFSRRLAGPPSATPPYLQHQPLELAPGVPLDLHPANPNWYTASGRLRIARPRPWDQLTVAEQSGVATTVGIAYPIPENLTPAQGNTLYQAILQAQRTGQLASPVLPYPVANADGTVSGDVRNYQTTNANQKADSVWLYLGSRPITWRGRKVVPMVAAMILDLSARANLNVSANTLGWAHTPYKQGTFPGIAWVRPLASRSSMGVGPHEINVGMLMRNTNPNRQPQGFDGAFANSPASPANPNSVPVTDWSNPAFQEPTVGELGNARQVKQGGPVAVDRNTGLPLVWNNNHPLPQQVPSDFNADGERQTNFAVPMSMPVTFTPPAFDMRPTFGLADPFPLVARPDPNNPRTFTGPGLLFHPGQWPRNPGRAYAGTAPHQFGMEEMRRAAGRHGISPAEAQRLQALTELGQLLTASIPVPGGPQPNGTGGFAPNPGALARSFFTGYSTTSTRPEVTTVIMRPGTPPVAEPVKLGPIALNRPLPDFRISQAVPLSPLNMYPLNFAFGAAFDPLGDPSNREAYKRYAPARQARQNLARDIFVRLAAVTRFVDPVGVAPARLIDGPQVSLDPNTGYLAHFDPVSGVYVQLVPDTDPNNANPPALGGNVQQARFNALRRLAQVAANLVDYVDPDDVHTTFVWNPTRTPPVAATVPLFADLNASDPTVAPGTGSSGRWNCLNNGWTAPGTPAVPLPAIARGDGGNGFGVASPPVGAFIDPSADANNFLPAALGATTVFGTELPRLALNEAHAEVTNHYGDVDVTGAPTGAGPAGSALRKRFLVELHNPFPQAGFDPALSEGGAARLRWFRDATAVGNGSEPDRPDYSAYRLEIFERPAALMNTSVVQLLGSQLGNVTGDINALVDSGALTAPPQIRVEQWENLGGTQAAMPPPPPNLSTLPTYLPGTTTAEVQANRSRYTVGSAGTPNGGYFVLGRNYFSNELAGPTGTPEAVTSRLPDSDANPPPTTLPPPAPPYTAGSGQWYATNTLSFDAGAASQGRLNAGGDARRPNCVVLRRLANPHLPPNPANDQAMGGNPVFNPFAPYNPYITVDVMDFVPTQDAVKKVNDNPPMHDHTPPANSNRAFGRYTPFAAGDAPDPNLFVDRTATPAGTPLPATAVTRLTTEPPAAGATHTIGQKNTNLTLPAGLTDHSPWPTHLDREPVSPVELAHASAVRPFELTARFAVPVQQPLLATAMTEPALTWHLHAHTVMQALTGRNTNPMFLNPPAGFYPNATTQQYQQLFGGETTTPPTPPAPPHLSLGLGNGGLPFADGRNADPANTQAAFGNWFRLLDVLTTRSRLPGMPVGGPEPGRINLNAVWDNIADPFVAAPNLPPYAGAPADPAPTTAGLWQSPTTSRMLKAILDPTDDPGTTVARNWFAPTDVAYMWQTNPTDPVQLPRNPDPTWNGVAVVGTARPTGRLLRTNDLGRLSPTQFEQNDATLWQTAEVLPGPVYQSYDKPFVGFAAAPSAEFSLLRPRADGNPLLFLSSPPQPHTGTGMPRPFNQTPYQVSRAGSQVEFPPHAQAEPLRKMMSSTSTVSDGFMVLLTVSYFEVRTDANDNPLFDATLNPAVTNLYRPLLGREAKREVPGDLRKQYVLVLDRSMMTAQGTSAGTAANLPHRTPGAVPWFTSLAADVTAGESRVVVSAARSQPQVFGSPPVVFVNGEPRPLLNATGATTLRLGFGEAKPTAADPGDGNDGEPVTVPDPTTVPTAVFDEVPMTETELQSAIGYHQARYGVVLTGGQARQQYSSGKYALRLATGVARSHGAGSPVSNALHAHPGTRPPLDLMQPASRGVVPYVAEVPKPQ